MYCWLRRQRRGHQQVDERPAGSLIEHLLGCTSMVLEASFDKAVREGVRLEPAQMPAVQQAAVLIPERAAQQAICQAPVFRVGYADQHHAVGRQVLGMAREHGERVRQMLQDRAVRDAIDVVLGMSKR